MLASLTLDLFVAHVNLFLAIGALGANVYAIRYGHPFRRPMHASGAALCVIYIVSYVILLGDFPQRILAWSRIMRGVSVVAWCIVWIAPPIMDVYLQRRTGKVADRLQSEVARRLGDGGGE